jgi:hypothetical protein
MRCIGDPQDALQGYRTRWEMEKQNENRMATLRQQQAERFQAMQKTNNGPPVPALPELPKFADGRFVGQTRQLIEILVGVGRNADAEKIRDQALTVVDDAQIKSAIADAEQRVKTFHSKQKP